MAEHRYPEKAAGVDRLFNLIPVADSKQAAIGCAAEVRAAGSELKWPNA